MGPACPLPGFGDLAQVFFFEISLPPYVRYRQRLFQNLAFVIDRTPQVMTFTRCLHGISSGVPTAGSVCAHPADPPFFRISGSKHRTEPVPQNRTVGLVADVVALVRGSSTFRGESGNRAYILNRQANDLRPALKVPEGGAFALPGTAKPPCHFAHQFR
jgi:hypothetical protein